MKAQIVNVEQALTASGEHAAYRIAGDRRIIVELKEKLLIIQIQRRRRKHWIGDDNGGGIRYLGGVVRDGTGRYCCPECDLTCFQRVRACLPLRDQELFLLESDDWYPLEREAV